MNSKVLKPIFISLLGVALLLSFSCSKGEEEQKAETKPEPVQETAEQEEAIPGETVTETEDLTPVEAPTYDEAFVIFSSGAVDYKPAESEEWLPVEIGQTLTTDDSLKVSDAAYCELQFGDDAVVKVKEATTISISRISLQEGEREVKVKMEAGSVLNRVEKLASGESFKVQTPSAVCGVRGTQFSIESSRDRKTRVAVKEGAVSVQPGTVDTDELRESVKGKGKELEQAIEQIEQSASVVSSNQEFDVDEKTAEESDKTVKEIAEVVEKIAEQKDETPSREDVEQVQKLAEENSKKAAEKQVAPREMSEEKKNELKEIDDMKLFKIEPIEVQEETAEKETKEGAEGEEAEPVSETEPKPVVLNLHKVSVKIEPQNAMITLNGRNRGLGSFSGVFNSDEELSFEITREGFKSHSFSITVDADTAKLYRIKLAKEKKEEPVTEKFEIETLPEDAEILLNGEKVADGAFSDSYRLGEKLNFTVQKDGYKERKINVDVSLGSGKTYKVDLERKTETVRLSAEPAGSEIILNGESVGTGSFEDEFPVGETLEFQVRNEGWKEQSFRIGVEEGDPIKREVSLERMLQGIQINAEPKDAEILLDGEVVGSGSFSDQYEPGEQLSFTIRRDGYKNENLDLTVTDEVQTFNVSLERSRQEIVVRTKPNDAHIIINGRREGTGSASLKLPSGRDLTITARRDGYESRNVSYTTKSSGSKSFSLELEPLPMQFTADVSDSGLIGNAVSYGNLVISANTDGKLFAVSRDGERRWEASTENGRNENSYPVVVGSTVFFTGAKEMVKVNADNGSIISRSPLSGDSAHLFGRRVVEYGGSVLLPTNSAIRLLDPSSGDLQQEISVPGGSRMTPGIWNDRIVTVNQQGTLLIINPDSGSVEAEVATAGMQPVALAPAIRENRAIFSGRKGTVVCVDLQAQKVTWERDLSGDSVSVFSDPECSPEGVYLFAGGTIYGLAMSDGSNMFSPIEGASSPPLYRNGKIFFGTENGGLSLADASSGKTELRVDSDEVISTRPVVTGGKFVAGTKDGTILVMNP